MVTIVDYHPHGSIVCCLLAGLLCLTLWDIRKHWMGIIVIFMLPVHELAIMVVIMVLPIGLQSRTGMMPQTCLLNNSAAGLSKPGPNGVVHICSRAIFMSLPDLAHFLNVHFIHFIQASTCPLLWWWYTNNVACSTLIALQNFQNLAETKFVPVSDIILQGIPYSANIILTALVRFLADIPSNLLTMGNLLL